MQLQDRARWYSDPTDADLVDEITRRMLEGASPGAKLARAFDQLTRLYDEVPERIEMAMTVLDTRTMVDVLGEERVGLTLLKWRKIQSDRVIQEAIYQVYQCGK